MTSPTPSWPVRWPVMYQTWSWLSFLHWSYEPAVVQRHLPGGLEVHTFDRRAWVGVTPFFLQDLRTPVAPALPWFTSFPETNVRTYVRGPDGARGSGSSRSTRPGCTWTVAVAAPRSRSSRPRIWLTATRLMLSSGASRRTSTGA